MQVQRRSWRYLLNYLHDHLFIVLPVLVAILIYAIFFTQLWKKDNQVPVLEIGHSCVFFTLLYTVLPLLNFYFGGLQFSILSDSRLLRYSPSAEELGLFSLNYLVYLAALSFSYLLFRPLPTNLVLLHVKLAPPTPSLVRVLVIGFVLLTTYFTFIYFAFRIGFKSGYGNEVDIVEGPLILQQINGALLSITDMIKIALVGYFLFCQKKDVRVRWLAFGIIGWNVANLLINPGSRGELMLLLLTALLLWTRIYKTQIKLLIVITLIILAFFNLTGFIRSLNDLSEAPPLLNNIKTIASANNEFQSLLGTTYDVNQILNRGTSPHFLLALNDFLPLLPPRQLIPIEKITGSDWYLLQINLYGKGVGYMWGVISQSLIGFGKIELILRGIILGWFLARVHSWYQARYDQFFTHHFISLFMPQHPLDIQRYHWGYSLVYMADYYSILRHTLCF